MEKVFIVVEGIADQVLLVDIFSHIFGISHEVAFSRKDKVNDKKNLVVDLKAKSENVSSFQITFLKASTNGQSIKTQKINEIRTATDGLNFKTLFILDADAPNFKETKESLIKNFGDENVQLPESDIFLLPDDSSDGCLENLLVQIVGDQSQSIFECFESYKDCIRNLNPGYTKPDLKTKIYAYSEIITKSGNERSRDYTDPEVWNLNHEALKPLTNFLKTHLS